MQRLTLNHTSNPSSSLPRWVLTRLAYLTGAILVPVGLGSAQTAPSVWNRCADWIDQPDSFAGTTFGNPSPDSDGNPVWNYEYVTTGGPLGSADPWYEEQAVPLVWDPAWFGQSGSGAWVVSNDFGTAVRNSNMAHVYGCNGSSCWTEFKPIARWQNATAESFSLDIRGSLVLSWSGLNNVASPMDVDVAIAFRRANTGSTTLLHASTQAKPTPDSIAESLAVPIDLNAAIAPGDELLVSLRAVSGVSDNRWVTLVDDLLLQRTDAPGSAYCTGGRNSTGCRATVSAAGSEVLVDNDFTLRVDGCPPFVSGIFFFGTNHVQIPFGEGFRCVGGAVQRLNPVVSTGPTGAIERALDLSQPPFAGCRMHCRSSCSEIYKTVLHTLLLLSNNRVCDTDVSACRRASSS